MSDINSYPLLDNKLRRTLTGMLGDLTPAKYHEDQVIDITSSPIIPASDLQKKLNLLQEAGEQDIGLPIISQESLVGFISAVTLASALNKIEDHTHTACLMSTKRSSYPQQGTTWHGDEADLTSYVDPVSLPIPLVSSLYCDSCCTVARGSRGANSDEVCA